MEAGLKETGKAMNEIWDANFQLSEQHCCHFKQRGYPFIHGLGGRRRNEEIVVQEALTCPGIPIFILYRIQGIFWT